MCHTGLPLNCYSPSVGLVGDQLLVTGGECDPHRVAAAAAVGSAPDPPPAAAAAAAAAAAGGGSGGGGSSSYWHYPRIALHGTLSSPAETGKL
jgi:hypothetical protein